MIAYKLFRERKDGSLGPLFINRKQVIKEGAWLTAETHPTKGFAIRPGWHCTMFPVAPHLKERLKSGEKRVWCRVEVEDTQLYERPESQGGTWVLANKLLVLGRLDELDTI